MANITNADEANAVINDPESSKSDVILAKAFLVSLPPEGENTEGEPTANVTEEKPSATAPAAAPVAQTAQTAPAAAAAATAPAAPQPAVAPAAAAAPAPITVAPTAHPTNILDALIGHIKAAEKAGETEAHGALVSFHAHLADLKTKLELIGHKVGPEAETIIAHLRAIL